MKSIELMQIIEPLQKGTDPQLVQTSVNPQNIDRLLPDGRGTRVIMASGLDFKVNEMYPIVREMWDSELGTLS